jgi:phosphotransferase system HPr (HPr) family protein
LRTYERKFCIKNRLGLHLRAANKLARVANQFKSDIIMGKDGLEVDAKSIMELTTLAVSCGSEVILKARGEDAREAVEAIGALIEAKFEEED